MTVFFPHIYQRLLTNSYEGKHTTKKHLRECKLCTVDGVPFPNDTLNIVVRCAKEHDEYEICLVPGGSSDEIPYEKRKYWCEYDDRNTGRREEVVQRICSRRYRTVVVVHSVDNERRYVVNESNQKDRE